jgi:hypothetical protein
VPQERYTTTTLDGYVLPVFRIPLRGSSKTVMLQHGLLDSPICWASSGRLFSLAFRAYLCGYDVWLGTYRGTADTDIASTSPQQSSNGPVHAKWTVEDSAFWYARCYLPLSLPSLSLPR